MSDLLAEHFDYLSDHVKLRRYGDAIAQIIQPGDVVLDLGCGSGVLGLACLRAGAGFVHAIEQKAVLEMARRTFAEAGFAGRVTCHRARAQHVSLPERVDVIVCDHVGYFGIDYGILDMVADAAHRCLTPGGRLLPRALHLHVAGVASARCRAKVDQWRGDVVPADYHWVGDVAAHKVHPVDLEPAELLTDPVPCAALTLGEEPDGLLSWTMELVAVREGSLDGIAGWCDTRLSEDVWMTNSPLAAERLQRPQAFLPLSAPVPVAAGEVIRVTVMFRAAERVLAWVVTLPRTGQRWSHSTWNGRFLDGTDLVRTRPDRRAVLTPQGRARRIVLDACDGVRTVAEVEARVLTEHPDLFPSRAELSAFVIGVLGGNIE